MTKQLSLFNDIPDKKIKPKKVKAQNLPTLFSQKDLAESMMTYRPSTGLYVGDKIHMQLIAEPHQSSIEQVQKADFEAKNLVIFLELDQETAAD